MNILLFSGGWYVYQQKNEVHNNSGIEIYYQTDMQSTHDNMLLELFCQIISEPCFNTLRTKEQLGEPTQGLAQHSLRSTIVLQDKKLSVVLKFSCQPCFECFIQAFFFESYAALICIWR